MILSILCIIVVAVLAVLDEKREAERAIDREEEKRVP